MKEIHEVSVEDLSVCKISPQHSLYNQLNISGLLSDNWTHSGEQTSPFSLPWSAHRKSARMVD